MAACPACGSDNHPEAKFCSECGAALAPASARRERKIVTVLFADLVGFTSRAEQMDPEDVQALLSEYHAHVRSELKRLGGTVEKFIGDAVMAVFGAPTAHEDDPERAVRAAILVRDWAQGHDALQVRVGINTGEAVVSLGARPAEGEGMVAGDVVNTAARLQAAAAPNAVLVGGTTYRATTNVIDYREAGDVEAKGKSEPVRAWEAVAARARFGVDVGHRAALVGRQRELRLLTETLARVREARSPQLVTLIGVPGIGKSRLVYELFRSIEHGSELTYWRQGRALPYGDGVSFWPMAEIAKAHTGILETDTPAQVEEKLHRSLSEVLDEDLEWVARQLRPLVGLRAEADLGGDRRGEAFVAWRRLFEALAERRPLVLVFEDLHWADEGMLDFVDHLVEWASGVPVLVLCTARPELLDRRPAWGAGKLNSAMVSLSPLSEEETARLVHDLLETPVLEAAVQETLLDRAGGNPLYAEEYARLLAEQGEVSTLPGTVQGIIAARLDLLPPEEKSLLQDAAVAGKVFSAGALRGAGVEERLHTLERKDFVARAGRYSVAGETEYVFRHILVRDVAYGQIPRAERAEKHLRTAEWIESLGRPEDHAELLAHHYGAALELARAAGQPVGELAERARQTLRDAGSRALALSAFAGAARYLERALELWPEEDPERPRLLLDFGRALWVSEERGEEPLEMARELGAAETAAEAEVALSRIDWARGRRGRSFEDLERAVELVADTPSSEVKGLVLSHLSRTRSLGGEHELGIRYGREALAIAEELGLEELRAHSLNNIGISRVYLGDRGGLEDVVRSIEIGRAANLPEAVARGHNNLAVCLGTFGDVPGMLEETARALEVAERYGDAVMLRHTRGWRPGQLFLVGRWDEALALAGQVIEEIEAGAAGYHESQVRRVRALIRFARGDASGAFDDLAKALAAARRVKDPQVLIPTLATHARLSLEAGRCAEAGSLIDEVLSLVAAHLTFDELLDVVVVLVALAREPQLARILDAPPATSWMEAARTYVAGDRRGAADILASIAAATPEAHYRLLAAEAGGPDAGEQLRQALAFYRSVGATTYISRAQALSPRWAPSDASDELD
jgi:class 3 adenylate cyclase/tetratricopeptide (TPR) repeat protein